MALTSQLQKLLYPSVQHKRAMRQTHLILQIHGFHTLPITSFMLSLLIPTPSTPRSPCINLIPMLPILKVDLEILDCHTRARSIQFARAVLTPYPRKIHVFDIKGGGLAG
jgi:hypothetical protein